ncbi:TlpA family protein disulfide reductase [Oxalobacteraceae bacterium A2-2]
MTPRLPQRLLPLLLLLAFPVPPAYGAPPASGDLAPDYVGKTLAGDPLAVSAYRGKVVVISFWATWCPYCLKELPVLEGIQKLAGANKVQVVAINTEDRETFRDASRVLKNYTLKLAYDPGKKSHDAYGVNGIPHLLIIGRDGRILSVYRGYDESSLNDIVEDLNSAIRAPGSEEGQPQQAQHTASRP